MELLPQPAGGRDASPSGGPGSLAAPRDAAEVAALLDLYYCLDWAYLEAERLGVPLPGPDRRQRDRPAALGAGVGGGASRALTTTAPPGWEEIDLST